MMQRICDQAKYSPLAMCATMAEEYRPGYAHDLLGALSPCSLSLVAVLWLQAELCCSMLLLTDSCPIRYLIMHVLSLPSGMLLHYELLEYVSMCFAIGGTSKSHGVLGYAAVWMPPDNANHLHLAG